MNSRCKIFERLSPSATAPRSTEGPPKLIFSCFDRNLKSKIEQKLLRKFSEVSFFSEPAAFPAIFFLLFPCFEFFFRVPRFGHFGLVSVLNGNQCRPIFFRSLRGRRQKFDFIRKCWNVPIEKSIKNPSQQNETQRNRLEIAASWRKMNSGFLWLSY